MTAERTRPSLVVWNTRALYTGPSVELAWHRNAVSVLVVGLDADFRLELDGGRDGPVVARCRSALIPADTRHRISFDRGDEACLYLDPRSTDVAALPSAMRRAGGAFIDHAREPALVDLMTRAARRPGGEAHRLELAELLELAPRRDIDERIGRALEAMHAAPDARHSLEALGAHVDLSPSRFLHLFKQQVGVPLRRYRLWARIGGAMRAIARGESLTEAAYGAGFASSAHLSTTFRNMFGLPPSAVARSIAE